MKMKNKLLNHFIGVLDERDEYQLQEINKDLAFSGIILWYLMLVLMFVSLVMDAMHNTLSFMTAALLVINMVYAIMVLIKVRKKGLDSTDCASAEEYENKKKLMKKSSVHAAIMFTFLSLIMFQYMFPYLSSGEVDLNWFDTFRYVFSGLLFGIGIYVLGLFKLKKNF